MNQISYIGHPSQLCGVEEHRLVGGRGDGLRLLQVKTEKDWNSQYQRIAAPIFRDSASKAIIMDFSLPAVMQRRPITMIRMPDGSKTLRRAF